jgi:branched-chain amino acid transport system ATP-binding protein
MGLARTFQQGGLWKTETALANLLMAQSSPAQLGSLRSVIALGRSEQFSEYRRRTIGEEVLTILRLQDYQDVPVHLMPYGSRKVLELGCALVSRPKLLLLDEPAAGMTEEESNWLAGVISDIRSELGMTVLIIEHHVPLIKRIAEHVDVLNFGKTIASGTPAEVTRNSAVLEAYLGRGATPRQATSSGNGVVRGVGGGAADTAVLRTKRETT